MDMIPATKSDRKPRGQGASRRAEILEAAKRLFLTEGFERATIRKLAAAVGVSSTTLYLYFPDKDSILRAIAESTFETLLSHLEDSERSVDTDIERFRSGLRAYIAFGMEHPDEYRLTFLAKMIASTSPGRQASPCENVAAADRSFDILVSIIGRLMQAGYFREADLVRTAEAVWACVHGVTALLLDQCEHLESTQGGLIDTVIEITERGLRA